MSEERATIAQIQQAYGERSAHILNQLHDRYEEIAKAKPETQGSFFDRPDDAQKAAVIRDHRLELANKARAEAKEKYAESAREFVTYGYHSSEIYGYAYTTLKRRMAVLGISLPGPEEMMPGRIAETAP